ncbi:MAG: GNAT family N-acetyltransferase [Chryseolinea sp.]
MESPLKVIADEKDFQAFRTVLKSSDLPFDDLNYQKDLLVGYIEDGALVGTGALEIYGAYALLRSLSVKLGTRGKALGTVITEYLIGNAKEHKLKGIYLLTDKAQGFFQRKGFTEVPRATVPQELHASSEFANARASVAMCLQL